MTGPNPFRSIPEASLLTHYAHSFNYVDRYQGTFSDEQDLVDIATVGRLFLTSGSTWVDALFAIRNKVAGMAGLKTPGRLQNRQQQVAAFMFEPGQRLGLFKVYEKTEQELVIGEDDKHLNFKVSLLLETLQPATDCKQVSITTAVTFHNAFGRLYFKLVGPFHKVIVKAMVKGMLDKIEKDKLLSTNLV